MKRVVKLTEQDLYRIVKRVIKEQASTEDEGKSNYLLKNTPQNCAVATELKKMVKNGQPGQFQGYLQSDLRYIIARWNEYGDINGQFMLPKYFKDGNYFSVGTQGGFRITSNKPTDGSKPCAGSGLYVYYIDYSYPQMDKLEDASISQEAQLIGGNLGVDINKFVDYLKFYRTKNEGFNKVCENMSNNINNIQDAVNKVRDTNLKKIYAGMGLLSKPTQSTQPANKKV